MGLRLPPSTPPRRAIGAVVLTTLALGLLSAFAGTLDGLAYLLPALLLAVTLAAGRYPGERALRTLGAARSRERARRRATSARRPASGPPRGTVPRGGELLGASLAVRPPPRLLSAHS